MHGVHANANAAPAIRGPPEPARVVGIEPVVAGVVVGGRPRAAPAPRGEDDERERRERGQHRHQPGGQLEAVVAGHGEHARPVLGHERVLDLLLRLALRDQLGDELALLVGDLGVRDVQRGAALEAHHLVLDVGKRGARLGGERRGRGDQREREQGGEQAHQADSASSGGSVSSSHFCVTGKRRTAATRPCRSST